MTHDERIDLSLAQAEPLVANLDPVIIIGMIEPIQTEGAVGGVNYHLVHANTAGLPVQVPVYVNMAANDWIEIYWGDDDVPVASAMVLPGDVGSAFSLFIPASRVPIGINPLYCKVTRTGGGNGGESLPINILVRLNFPGGTDPEPDNPGHQNLLPPEPELPDNGIIDEEAAKNGVKVTIAAYPNIRRYDRITLSWGGVLINAEVTQDDIDAGFIDILVTEDVILAAGDSDELILVYDVVDEIHNRASAWSMRTLVTVEVGKDLLMAPLIVNPDESDPREVIDLDDLGDDDLTIQVVVLGDGGLQAGDEVALKWVGTTSLGLEIVVEPEVKIAPRPPAVMTFSIPNADVRGLGGGRGVASYTASRDGAVAGVSKRAFVTFLGAEVGLPKPEVSEAVGGALDPDLAQATVVIPGEVLQGGDVVFLTWLGTRPNGTPLLHTDRRQVSGGGGGQPMSFYVTGEDWIKPLEGGRVSVYYSLGRAGADLPLESEREELTIGEAAAELPAPTTRPPAQNGMLDPDRITGQLEIVVTAYPDMLEDQTVHLLWQASKGPNHSDSMLINEFSAGYDVVFTLSAERVRENLGAQVEISYWVEEEGRPPRMSAVASMEIGSLKLPLPIFTAAGAGNQLNPDDVTDGAEVLIGDAAALKAGDKVTVQVISEVSGGTHSIDYEVPPGDDGKPVRVRVPHEVIVASLGTEITLSYEVQRQAGGPIEASDSNVYRVVEEIDAGTLLVMGARHSASTNRGSSTPKILSAFDENSLQPLLVEWRYDGGTVWKSGMQWTDTHPELRLYVRSANDAVVLNPANIIGNGSIYGTLPAAFVAMRDEREVTGGTEVDVVAWGSAAEGGDLSEEMIAARDVVEVSGTTTAFAALLRTGRAATWGVAAGVALPPEENGDFARIRSNGSSFVGQKTNGQLVAWAGQDAGAPIPVDIRQYRDYVEICGCWVAFAARRATGHVVAWGRSSFGGKLRPGQEKYTDITQILAGYHAIAAMRGNPGSGQVIAWGSDDHGGFVPPPIAALTNVKVLAAATVQAMTVILADNSVRSWGPRAYGGEVPDTIQRLTNVVEVTSTYFAFCARLSDGSVVAWGGGQDTGGIIPEPVSRLRNIVQVTANLYSFAALCRDGTVVAWGHSQRGGDTSKVDPLLRNVRAIYSNAYGFTALTADKQVVTWGLPASGGDSSKVQPDLVNMVTHSRRISLEEAQVKSEAIAGVADA